MKRFKIGFLAIIAVLAMSFTIADYKGVLAKIKTSKTSITCFQNAPYYEEIKFNGVNKIVGVDNCFVASTGAQVCAEPITTNTNQRDCDGSNTFCCAVLVASNPLGCSAPEETFEIYCEP